MIRNKSYPEIHHQRQRQCNVYQKVRSKRFQHVNPPQSITGCCKNEYVEKKTRSLPSRDQECLVVRETPEYFFIRRHSLRHFAPLTYIYKSVQHVVDPLFVRRGQGDAWKCLVGIDKFKTPHRHHSVKFGQHCVHTVLPSPHYISNRVPHEVAKHPVREPLPTTGRVQRNLHTHEYGQVTRPLEFSEN